MSLKGETATVTGSCTGIGSTSRKRWSPCRRGPLGDVSGDVLVNDLGSFAPKPTPFVPVFAIDDRVR